MQGGVGGGETRLPDPGVDACATPGKTTERKDPEGGPISGQRPGLRNPTGRWHTLRGAESTANHPGVCDPRLFDTTALRSGRNLRIFIPDGEPAPNFRAQPDGILESTPAKLGEGLGGLRFE